MVWNQTEIRIRKILENYKLVPLLLSSAKARSTKWSNWSVPSKSIVVHDLSHLLHNWYGLAYLALQNQRSVKFWTLCVIFSLKVLLQNSGFGMELSNLCPVKAVIFISVFKIEIQLHIFI